MEAAEHALLNTTGLQFLSPDDITCPYPAFFVYVSHLILLSISSLVQIEHMTKLSVVVVVTTVYSVLYMVVFGSLFDYFDAVLFEQYVRVTYWRM